MNYIEDLEFEMPNPGEENHWIAGDFILFVRVEYDECPPNPLEDWDGTGKIYSFNRRHVNFYKGDPRDAFGRWRCPECGADEYHLDFEWYHEDGDGEKPVIYCHLCDHHTPQSQKDDWHEEFVDLVPLGYFEHGMCLWHVSDEIPRGTEGDYRWDGINFAGFWEPDEVLLKEVEGLGPVDRRKKMVQFARQACDVYTDWCNGQVYGYVVEAYTHRLPYDRLRDYRYDAPEYDDSCWGFYGWSDFEGEVKSVWERAVEKLGSESRVIGGAEVKTEEDV